MNTIGIQCNYNTNTTPMYAVQKIVQLQYKHNTNTAHIQYKYNANKIQINHKYNTNTIQIQ